MHESSKFVRKAKSKKGKSVSFKQTKVGELASNKSITDLDPDLNIFSNM